MNAVVTMNRPLPIRWSGKDEPMCDQLWRNLGHTSAVYLEFGEWASERLELAAIRYGDQYCTRLQHHVDGPNYIVWI